jgi:hypothetical protein
MKYQSPGFILFISFITILFITGCSNSDEIGGELKVSVVSEFELAESTQEYVGRMYPSVANNPKAEELAFSNYTSPIRIVITNYQGEYIETIGKEGRGPEEILSARFFGFDNQQNLVILDKVGGLFKKYNRTTGEVNSFIDPVKEGIFVNSRNLQMCKDKWYLGVEMLNRSSDTNVPTIAVFDTVFNVVDTLGGYDPFFNGRKDVMQDPKISVDCGSRRIYTTHGKVPYIQVFSMDSKKRLGRTEVAPPSFMLSEEFVTMVTDSREWNRFLTEEQSLSLKIAYTDNYIYHVFRNEGGVSNTFQQPKDLNERNHFVAVYDKESLEFLGETELPGAVLGSTKEGNLIVLSDELEFKIQFVNIVPVPELAE